MRIVNKFEEFLMQILTDPNTSPVASTDRSDDLVGSQERDGCDRRMVQDRSV